MSATKRQAPPTHPSVWVGLGLAAIGLLVAAYAYTGTRVYDITFALVALLGGILALAGILVSAWGRAVMGARAQRASRAPPAAAKAAKPEAPARAEPMPTVAAPPSKSKFSFPTKRAKPAPAEGAQKPKFAFPTRAKPANGSVQLERLSLRCPECATRFDAEGSRPFRATCPTCAFASEIA